MRVGQLYIIWWVMNRKYLWWVELNTHVNPWETKLNLIAKPSSSPGKSLSLIPQGFSLFLEKILTRFNRD